MKSLIQGFLTVMRDQAHARTPRQVTSPRFSRHLNTPREISLLWGRIPSMGVQVPPRTHRCDSLTCRYTYVIRFREPPDCRSSQVRTMGVQVGLISRDGNIPRLNKIHASTQTSSPSYVLCHFVQA